LGPHAVTLAAEAAAGTALAASEEATKKAAEAAAAAAANANGPALEEKPIITKKEGDGDGDHDEEDADMQENLAKLIEPDAGSPASKRIAEAPQNAFEVQAKIGGLAKKQCIQQKS
jgi:hypothetical protein